MIRQPRGGRVLTPVDSSLTFHPPPASHPSGMGSERSPSLDNVYGWAEEEDGGGDGEDARLRAAAAHGIVAWRNRGSQPQGLYHQQFQQGRPPAAALPPFSQTKNQLQFYLTAALVAS